jgi:hypothetical protein
MVKVSVGAGLEGGVLQLALRVSPGSSSPDTLSDRITGPLSGRSATGFENI